MAHEAKQYAQRNRQGSDWFSHDSGTGPVKPASPVPEPVAAAVEEPAAVDENNVDKSPAAETAAAPATPPAPVSARAQMIKPKCDSNEWYKYEHGGSGEEDKSGGETRREKDGAVYGRRDKTGSASEWFSHDHTGNAQQQRSGRAVTCGSANAARMRSESDCWYNYDKAAVAEETNVHKKRAAPVKPGANEMHGVFHHATADN